MEQKIIHETANRIIEKFPKLHTETDPWKVLVTTVISQRNRDEMTEKASKTLFVKYGDAFSLCLSKAEDLYPLLNNIGLFRQKSKRIIEISRIIVTEYEGRVPGNLGQIP